MPPILAPPNHKAKSHVVIIGAGFGGLAAVRGLAHSGVTITLVDRQNHHVFQPLLYQVATAGLSPADIAAPIRSIVKHQKQTRVLLAEVTGVNAGQRRVLLSDGATLDYDALVIATGARHSYFGRDEWAEHAPGIKTIDDLRTKPLIIGAPSNSGDTYLQPLAIKNVLGLDKLKIITGYPGTREIALAIEQGELEGRVWDMDGVQAARPNWLKDHLINILAQLAPKKMPEVPADVPLIKDYVANDEDKKVLDVIFMSTILARPYIAPPGVPAERVHALREAFMATMRDPAFVDETARLALTIDPTSGAEMEQIIRENYTLPESIILKVRKALQGVE